MDTYRDDDAPPPRPPRRWWLWRLIGVLTVLMIAFFCLVSALFSYRTVRSVDVVTGTRKWENSSFFGMLHSTHYVVSPLEERLKAEGIEWQATWLSMGYTERSVFGGYRIACRFHQRPSIYEMHSLMEYFVDGTTHEELVAFVRVMQFGTRQEQEAAVTAASDMVMHEDDWKGWGRAEARRDIANGKLRLRGYGYPDSSTPEFFTQAKEKFGVEFHAVAGCVVRPGLVDRVAGYNEVMQAEIDRRFGPMALEMLREESKLKQQEEQDKEDHEDAAGASH